ncbi:hypothetical protein ACQ86N_39255 [Puia sp. P3]|uniref:hypothetical protein n=1 Tax=Puia sp. P3 TaxID=3423952 RepID=UPI003D67B2E5
MLLVELGLHCLLLLGGLAAAVVVIHYHCQKEHAEEQQDQGTRYNGGRYLLVCIRHRRNAQLYPVYNTALAIGMIAKYNTL